MRRSTERTHPRVVCEREVRPHLQRQKVGEPERGLQVRLGMQWRRCTTSDGAMGAPQDAKASDEQRRLGTVRRARSASRFACRGHLHGTPTAAASYRGNTASAEGRPAFRYGSPYRGAIPMAREYAGKASVGSPRLACASPSASICSTSCCTRRQSSSCGCLHERACCYDSHATSCCTNMECLGWCSGCEPVDVPTASVPARKEPGSRIWLAAAGPAPSGDGNFRRASYESCTCSKNSSGNRCSFLGIALGYPLDICYC